MTTTLALVFLTLYFFGIPRREARGEMRKLIMEPEDSGASVPLRLKCDCLLLSKSAHFAPLLTALPSLLHTVLILHRKIMSSPTYNVH